MLGKQGDFGDDLSKETSSFVIAALFGRYGTVRADASVFMGKTGVPLQRNCKDSAIPAAHRYFEKIESSKFATYQGLAGFRCKPRTSKTRIWTRRMCRCARSPSRIKLSATQSTPFIGCRVVQPLAVIIDDWLLRRIADAPSFKFRVVPSLLFTSLRSPLSTCTDS